MSSKTARPRVANLSRKSSAASAKGRIDLDYLLKLLRRLLEIPSPTGYTDEVVRYCCHELDALGIDYEITRRGAIRAKIEGPARPPARALTQWGE